MVEFHSCNQRFEFSSIFGSYSVISLRALKEDSLRRQKLTCSCNLITRVNEGLFLRRALDPERDRCAKRFAIRITERENDLVLFSLVCDNVLSYRERHRDRSGVLSMDLLLDIDGEVCDGKIASTGLLISEVKD